jgi:bifunctional non-homologous end joining protein LigD
LAAVGEAIVCDGNGLAVFHFVRNYRRGNAATLCAFDLIEINGQDLRRQPIEDRKLVLKELFRSARPGIAYNRHCDVEGGIVFHHAGKLGCEGIVSKRLGSPYTSGRVDDWLKIKNPAAPAVRRQAEEDWSSERKTR